MQVDTPLDLVGFLARSVLLYATRERERARAKGRERETERKREKANWYQEGDRERESERQRENLYPDLDLVGFLAGSVFLYATMLSRNGSIKACPVPDTCHARAINKTTCVTSQPLATCLRHMPHQRAQHHHI